MPKVADASSAVPGRRSLALISILKIAGMFLLMFDAEVTTLDGHRYSGQLEAVNQQQIVLSGEDKKPVAIPLADTMELRLTSNGSDTKTSDALRVVLVDK